MLYVPVRVNMEYDDSIVLDSIVTRTDNIFYAAPILRNYTSGAVIPVVSMLKKNEGKNEQPFLKEHFNITTKKDRYVKEPYLLAMAQDGDLVVGDENNYTIETFDSTPKSIKKWLLEKFPYQIAVSEDKTIFVDCSKESKQFIVTYSFQGEKVNEFEVKKVRAICVVKNELYTIHNCESDSDWVSMSKYEKPSENGDRVVQIEKFLPNLSGEFRMASDNNKKIYILTPATISLFEQIFCYSIDSKECKAIFDPKSLRVDDFLPKSIAVNSKGQLYFLGYGRGGEHKNKKTNQLFKLYPLNENKI